MSQLKILSSQARGRRHSTWGSGLMAAAVARQRAVSQPGPSKTEFHGAGLDAVVQHIGILVSLMSNHKDQLGDANAPWSKSYLTLFSEGHKLKKGVVANLRGVLSDPSTLATKLGELLESREVSLLDIAEMCRQELQSLRETIALPIRIKMLVAPDDAFADMEPGTRMALADLFASADSKVTERFNWVGIIKALGIDATAGDSVKEQQAAKRKLGLFKAKTRQFRFPAVVRLAVRVKEISVAARRVTMQGQLQGKIDQMKRWAELGQDDLREKLKSFSFEYNAKIGGVQQYNLAQFLKLVRQSGTHTQNQVIERLLTQFRTKLMSTRLQQTQHQASLKFAQLGAIDPANMAKMDGPNFGGLCRELDHNTDYLEGVDQLIADARLLHYPIEDHLLLAVVDQPLFAALVISRLSTTHDSTLLNALSDRLIEKGMQCAQHVAFMVMLIEMQSMTVPTYFRQQSPFSRLFARQSAHLVSKQVTGALKGQPLAMAKAAKGGYQGTTELNFDKFAHQWLEANGKTVPTFAVSAIYERGCLDSVSGIKKKDRAAIYDAYEAWEGAVTNVSSATSSAICNLKQVVSPEFQTAVKLFVHFTRLFLAAKGSDKSAKELTAKFVWLRGLVPLINMRGFEKELLRELGGKEQVWMVPLFVRVSAVIQFVTNVPRTQKPGTAVADKLRGDALPNMYGLLGLDSPRGATAV